MKIVSAFFLLIGMLVLYTSCKQASPEKNVKPYFTHIDLAGNLDNTTSSLLLSNVAGTIEIIPLETKKECLISKVEDMWLAGDNIIIFSHYKQSLLRFSRDGKFLNKIGIIGKGPGECVYIGGVAVNEAQNEVYINLGDGIQAGFMVYDFEGHFKRKITFNTFEQFATLLPVLLFSDSTAFFKQDLPVLNPEVGMWNLAVLDSLLQPVKTISNPLYKGREAEIAENCCLYYGWTQYYIEHNPVNIYKNKLKMMYHGADTIYQYHPGQQSLTPAYSVAMGARPSFSKCRKWIKDQDFFSYLWINDFYDTRDFIYLQAGKDEYAYLAQFDKRNGNVTVLKEKGEIFEYTFPNGWVHKRRKAEPLGLTNDLCGYPASFPPHPVSPKGEWGMVIDSYQLLSELDTEQLRQQTVKDPAARDKVQEIATKLTDESNPVIFIATLK